MFTNIVRRTVIEMLLIVHMKEELDSILYLESLHRNSHRNVTYCVYERRAG